MECRVTVAEPGPTNQDMVRSAEELVRRPHLAVPPLIRPEKHETVVVFYGCKPVEVLQSH
jgi:hypothetical protein